MKKLSDLLNTQLDTKLKEFSGVSRAWQSAAGEGIGFMTGVSGFKNGILTVAVYDQAWLTELNFMKGELTERLKQSGIGVSSISFYYKSRRIQRTDDKPPKRAMTDREKQYADRIIDNISDDVLKDSFRKALYSYFTVYTLDDYLG